MLAQRVKEPVYSQPEMNASWGCVFFLSLYDFIMVDEAQI